MVPLPHLGHYDQMSVWLIPAYWRENLRKKNQFQRLSKHGQEPCIKCRIVLKEHIGTFFNNVTWKSILLLYSVILRTGLLSSLLTNVSRCILNKRRPDPDDGKKHQFQGRWLGTVQCCQCQSERCIKEAKGAYKRKIKNLAQPQLLIGMPHWQMNQAIPFEVTAPEAATPSSCPQQPYPQRAGRGCMQWGPEETNWTWWSTCEGAKGMSRLGSLWRFSVCVCLSSQPHSTWNLPNVWYNYHQPTTNEQADQYRRCHSYNSLYNHMEHRKRCTNYHFILAHLS